MGCGARPDGDPTRASREVWKSISIRATAPQSSRCSSAKPCLTSVDQGRDTLNDVQEGTQNKHEDQRRSVSACSRVVQVSATAFCCHTIQCVSSSCRLHNTRQMREPILARATAQKRAVSFPPSDIGSPLRSQCISDDSVSNVERELMESEQTARQKKKIEKDMQLEGHNGSLDSWRHMVKNSDIRGHIGCRAQETLACLLFLLLARTMTL